MNRSVVFFLSWVGLLFCSATAFAQASSFVPVQGVLTDSQGEAIEGSIAVTFRLYGPENAGMSELWTSTRDVDFESGHFSVYLGATQPLDPALFDANRRMMLGITIGDDTEMPLIEIGTTPYAGFADFAGNAGTLQGRTADEIDSFSQLACQADEFLQFDGSAWSCVTLNTSDTLAALTCGADQIARFDGTDWTCATDAALTESDVDQFVANNGYALASNLSAVATSGNFADLANIPAGVLDGDDDTLGGLSCMPGEVARRGAAGWICGADQVNTYTGLSPVSVSGTDISLTAGAVTNTYLASGIDPAKVTGTAATLTGNQSFDSGTLAIDATNDRIGVGTVAPATALDVNGTITASDFAWATPKSGTVHVSSFDFVTVGVEDDLMRQNSSGYLSPETVGADSIFSSILVSAVKLPIGATVTELRCGVYDSHATENITGSVSLRRQLETSTSTSLMASASLATSASNFSIQPMVDATITSPTVESNARFLLQLSFTASNGYTGTSLRFYGCAVDYTMTAVGP